jgi:ABC exporter DevB family membrane fusion protein
VRRSIAILLLALVLLGGAVLAYRSSASSTGGEKSGSALGGTATGAAARRSITALGTLEPRAGVIAVTSAMVGCQITAVNVQDGQFVKPGDVLVELDSAAAEAEHQLALATLAEAQERQQAEIALAKERVASAQLAVDQAIEGRQLELDVQQSRVKVAAAKKAQTAKELERVEDLRKLTEPLATKQQVEQQRVLLEAATAEHEAAEVALRRTEQVLVFQQQTTAAELRAAQQSLAVAEKGTGIEPLKRRVELAALKLKQTKVVSPSGGVVLSVLAHAGENVAQQPLLQMADLDRLVCLVEVDAGDVPYLKANQPAVVRCRALPDAELSGTVDRIGNEVSSATLRPLDPRQPVDRNVTKVVVLVDSKKAARLMNAAGKDRRAALVGLQAEVEFPLSRQGK